MAAQRMKLRYGFNEIDGWAAFAMGDHRKRIQERMRLMDTKVVRVFVFDKPVPDPVKEWHWFASVLQAVLDIGAKPMITFAKFLPPFDDPRNIRDFSARCAEVVWSCIDNFGGDEVKDWYFCVWNEPNNPEIGGDVQYADYRRIYEHTGTAVLELLNPYLGGKKAMIGGPSIDGTKRPYWMDWLAQMAADIDERMLGFVNWHMYADWRPAVRSDTIGARLWDAPDSPNGRLFERLMMAQTPQYEARARGVARLLQGRDILNVCGELNTVAHHEIAYTRGLNQNAFGAAYYASALIHLIRGGAELEMRWTAVSKELDWGDRDDAYGLIRVNGDPFPAALGKQIFAQHVRHGDFVQTPERRLDAPEVDAIFAWNGKRRSAVFVNTSAKELSLRLSDWDGDSSYNEILRLDSSAGGKVTRKPFDGIVSISGYGMAVVSNAAADTVID